MATPAMKPYFRRRKSRLQKSAGTALVIALLYAIIFSQLDWMIPRNKSHPWLEPTLPWSLVVDDMSTVLVLNSVTVYVLVVLFFGILPELVGHKKQRVGPPAHSRIPPPPPPPKSVEVPPKAAKELPMAQGNEFAGGGSPSDAAPSTDEFFTNDGPVRHRARTARAA